MTASFSADRSINPILVHIERLWRLLDQLLWNFLCRHSHSLVDRHSTSLPLTRDPEFSSSAAPRLIFAIFCSGNTFTPYRWSIMLMIDNTSSGYNCWKSIFDSKKRFSSRAWKCWWEATAGRWCECAHTCCGWHRFFYKGTFSFHRCMDIVTHIGKKME